MQEATTLPATEARYNITVWRESVPFEQSFRGARAWTVAGSFLLIEDEEHKTFVIPATAMQNTMIESYLIDTLSSDAGDTIESEDNNTAE